MEPVYMTVFCIILLDFQSDSNLYCWKKFLVFQRLPCRRRW